jgi:hypothetical protein
LSLPKDAVFFSGDGGLKYLMSRQFLRGNVSPDLVFPSASGGGELWKKGLYPFGAPFVYDINNWKIVSFSLYFPLASVPFLAAMGWRGLYVLPAAGVIFAWIWMILCCHAARICTTAVCAVFVSIIFASPLTLYGGME